MKVSSTIIHRNFIFTLIFTALCFALACGGSQSTVLAESSEDCLWSEKKYHHLDMGVQLAYKKSDGGMHNLIYGDGRSASVHSIISFNKSYKSIKVEDVYPLESPKGRQLNFNADISSMNIGANAADKKAYYDLKYKDHVSLEMTLPEFISNGLNVSFRYKALPKTKIALDVTEYGAVNEDDEIYSLFNGKDALRENQPKVYEAIEAALAAGRGSPGDADRLYLVFCPMVIEYRIPADETFADAVLDIPQQAFTGDEYEAKDASHVSKNSYIKKAVLRVRRAGSGEDFEQIAVWHGDPRAPGVNTGGVQKEKKQLPGLYEYMLQIENNRGRSDTDTKTVRIVDKSTLEVEARLVLPEETYVGHEVIAKDSSKYYKDGECFSAEEAYSMNMGSGSFAVTPEKGAKLVNFETLRSRLRFEHPGVYEVTLTATTACGDSDTDVKKIRVKEVPVIDIKLSGLQKQNRKQRLSANFIYHPRDEIKSCQLELCDLKTGETAVLNAESPSHVGECIKTRKMSFQELENAEGYARCSVEFLTKKPDFAEESRAFTARASIVLNSGKKAENALTFTVLPDLPPKARISVSEKHVRDKNSNIAEIIAEDASESDGDLLGRVWSVNGRDVFGIPGSKDYSFGNKKKISFLKEGVGHVAIDLRVTDDFIEETLPEFIGDEDFLSDCTSASTEVDNIAPTVSVDIGHAAGTDINVMAEASLEKSIVAKLSGLEIALRDEGIDPHLKFIPTGRINASGESKLNSFKWTHPVNCSAARCGVICTPQHFYNIVCEDSENASGEGGGESDCHRLSAYPAQGEAKPIWSRKLSSAKDFSVFVDEFEKYLIVSHKDGKRSRILDAASGDILIELDYSLPHVRHYVGSENGHIYFPDKTGLYRLKINHESPHSLSVLKSEPILCHYLSGGKLTWFSNKNAVMPLHLKKVEFSMDSEEFKEFELPAVELPDELQRTHFYRAGDAISVEDIDVQGNVLLKLPFSGGRYGNYRSEDMIAYISNGGKISVLTPTLGRGDEAHASAAFVKNSAGEARYCTISVKYEEGYSSSGLDVNIHPMDNGKLGVSKNIYAGAANEYDLSEIIYAHVDDASGEIEIMTAGRILWDTRAYGFKFKLNKGELEGDKKYISAAYEKLMHTGAQDYSGGYYLFEKRTPGDKTYMQVENLSRNLSADEAYRAAAASYIPEEKRRDSIVHILRENDVDGMLMNARKSAMERSLYDKGLRLRLAGDNTNGNAYLAKKYKLEPGREYNLSFEYIAKGENAEQLRVVPKITQELEYAGSQSSMDAAHTNVLRGVYKAEKIIPLDCSALNGKKYGTVKFQVPDGYFALLKYDAVIRTDRRTCWRDGIYVDGIPDGQLPFKREEIKSGFRQIIREGHVFPHMLSSGVHVLEKQKLDSDGHQDIMNSRLILYKESSSGGILQAASEKEIHVMLGTDFSLRQEAEATGGWHLSSGKIKMHEDYALLGAYDASLCSINSSPHIAREYMNERESAAGTGYALNDSLKGAVKAFAAAKLPGDHNGYVKIFDESYPVTQSPYYFKDMIGTGKIVNFGDVSRNGRVDFAVFAKNGAAAASGSSFLIYPQFLEGRKDLCFSDTEMYDHNLKYDENGLRKSQVFAPIARSKKTAVLTMECADMKKGSEVFIRNLKLYYIDDTGRKVYAEDFDGGMLECFRNFELNNLIADDGKLFASGKETTAIYAKNERIAYDVIYSDYESDPSGASFWSYEHTPYNDGQEELAEFITDAAGNTVRGKGTVLSKPIERFAKDGKYIARHWQRDRTGDPAYDKYSKKCEIVFYVRGVPNGNAPWVKSIATNPVQVNEGAAYGITAEVDDKEKDILCVLIEVYHKGKLIEKRNIENIAANDKGEYPGIDTGILKYRAETGAYDIVVTVRDKDGAGFDKKSFYVKQEVGIQGRAAHSQKWEERRRAHNLKYPAKQRGADVFYSREEFMLEAVVAGKAESVDVRIKEYPEYKRKLERSGDAQEDGKALYRGVIADEKLCGRLLRDGALTLSGRRLTFKFRARYSGGITKECEVAITVRDENRAARLHRLY